MLSLQQQESIETGRKLDIPTFSSIVSRAKYQVRMLNDGYSRGDSHRKHIFQRFEYLSQLKWSEGDMIACDKCNKPIEMYSPIFIHKRRSYNRYFHSYCAKIMNLI